MGLLAAVLLPVPYVVLSPGPVFDTLGEVGGTPLISISGAPTYPTSGRLDLTTVSESGGPRGRLSVVDALRGWVATDEVVVPRELLYPPDQTADEVDRENTAAMTDSQDAATYAALRYLDLPVTDTVTVAEVDPDGPSQGKLEVGDRFLAVDDRPVSTPVELREEVSSNPPGTAVTLRVERDGRELDVVVTTVAADDDPTVSRIGVVPGVGFVSPVDVTIRLDDVGGPSAGLMFSLGIVDKLTPVQENGGRHVAGTGTIDAAGAIGPIGGIEQKLVGARQAGATLFFVPEGNCAAAASAAPDGLRLAKVATLDDAMAALDVVRTGRGTFPSC